MGKVDWDKPIEAVRKSDGKVVPVTVDRKRSWFASGLFFTNESPSPICDVSQWLKDGAAEKGAGWFIRNVQPTNTVTIERKTEEEWRKWISENMLKWAHGGIAWVAFLEGLRVLGLTVSDPSPTDRLQSLLANKDDIEEAITHARAIVREMEGE